MRAVIAEQDLPVEVSTAQAVEAAYAAELAEVAGALERGLPVLISCEKELTLFLAHPVRVRLVAAGLSCISVDGRSCSPDRASPDCLGLMAAMTAELHNAV